MTTEDRRPMFFTLDIWMMCEGFPWLFRFNAENNSLLTQNPRQIVCITRVTTIVFAPEKVQHNGAF